MRFPKAPPLLRFDDLFERIQKIGAHVSPTISDGRYLHWDQLRRRPTPDGLTHDEWWFGQAFARLGGRVMVPGFAEGVMPFWFCRLDAIARETHALDRRDAARAMLEAMGDDGAKTEYRIDQLMEEAISSSLIEGAKLTTRAQAKEMIRDERAPSSRGEIMVLNNYRAMTRLLALTNRDLSLDDLLEIHAILGADALESPNAEGRLRTEHDEVRVEEATTGEVWFVPPPATELRERMALMLAFANHNDDSGPFIHPLLRAIILHFWLAYLHPFVDGNGRMARALFYWQLLRSGYDFAQYLSISGPIDRAPQAYYMAFAHTETDNGDLTYFILHQLSVLKEATENLVTHLQQRANTLRELSKNIAHAEQLNHRQKSALAFLLHNMHEGLTTKGHANSHQVTYLTARKDLQDLETAGLVRRVRVGKTDRYLASEALTKRAKS